MASIAEKLRKVRKEELDDSSVADQDYTDQSVLALLDSVATRGNTLSKLLVLTEAIETWKSLMTDADGDAVINTITELIAAFNGIPEGDVLATLINAKASLIGAETLENKTIDAPLLTGLLTMDDTTRGGVAAGLIRVAQNGTVNNKAGIITNASRTALGHYTITTSVYLPETNFVALVTPIIYGAAPGESVSAVVNTIGASSYTFDVYLYDSSGSPIDYIFTVALFRM